MSEQGIPNGRYVARAVDAILGESGRGKEQLEITWEILGVKGDDGKTAECEHTGAQVVSQHYFTGGAKPITMAMMKHVGWTEGADLDTLRGSASITLYDDTYQGETTQKVKVFVPQSGSGGYRTPEGKRKSPAAAKAFLSRLGDGGGSSGGAFDDVPTDDPPPMPGDDAAPGTDDLPF